MNKEEAKNILDCELERLSSQSYSYFHAWLQSKHVEAFEVTTDEGTQYQIEIQAIEDDSKGSGNLRILGSIDDGGLISGLKPLCSDFIISPDGTVDR